MDKYKCYDCGAILDVGEDKEIAGGKMLVYKTKGEDIKVTKCDDCLKINPTLANYQDCEVYSRVVGFFTQVERWHNGKQEEFSERKEFKCDC